VVLVIVVVDLTSAFEPQQQLVQIFVLVLLNKLTKTTTTKCVATEPATLSTSHNDKLVNQPTASAKCKVSNKANK